MFPGLRAIGDHEEMEEERRLCYVAITRAKNTLTISHARQRMLYGRTSAAMASRFVREIPENVMVKKGGFKASNGYESGTASFGYSRAAAYVPMPPKEHTYVTPAKTVKAPLLELSKGDMVQHTAFGRGLVLSVLKMGGDALLEIAFDQVGTKKLMHNTIILFIFHFSFLFLLKSRFSAFNRK